MIALLRGVQPAPGHTRFATANASCCQVTSCISTTSIRFYLVKELTNVLLGDISKLLIPHILRALGVKEDRIVNRPVLDGVVMRT